MGFSLNPIEDRSITNRMAEPSTEPFRVYYYFRQIEIATVRRTDGCDHYTLTIDGETLPLEYSNRDAALLDAGRLSAP
jgi:hypothetical protein